MATLAEKILKMQIRQAIYGKLASLPPFLLSSPCAFSRPFFKKRKKSRETREAVFSECAHGHKYSKLEAIYTFHSLHCSDSFASLRAETLELGMGKLLEKM